MVTEQQTFVSKVAQGALASAVALQLALPVPVGALTFEASENSPASTAVLAPAAAPVAAPAPAPVAAPAAAPVAAAPVAAPAPAAVPAPAAPIAAPVPSATTEAAGAADKAEAAAVAKAEAAKAEAKVAAIAKLQAEEAAAIATAEAQKAASALAKAEAAAVAKVEQGYDAAYATTLKKATAEVKAEPSSDLIGGFIGKGKEMLNKAGEMTSSASTESDSESDFLSGVGGKGVILPLIAGFAVLSVTETVFNRMVDDNARKTGGKLSANDIYEASKPTGSEWLKTALSGPPDQPAAAARPAPAPTAPGRAAAAQRRSAPDILFGGLSNLGKDPLGWCFGPPSSLYSNAGWEPTSASMYNNPSTTSAAGFQPPSAAGNRASSQPYPAPSATEATRDGDEDVAKTVWLANQARGMQPPAPEPWQAPTPEPWQAAAPEPWNLSPSQATAQAAQPSGVPAAPEPLESPQQAEDGYLRDPTSWSSKM